MLADLDCGYLNDFLYYRGSVFLTTGKYTLGWACPSPSWACGREEGEKRESKRVKPRKIGKD